MATECRLSQLVVEVISDQVSPEVRLSQLIVETGGIRTRIVPNHGVEDGGTTVHIYGGDFTEDVEITFDGELATEITWITANEISCITPAHSWGSVTVEIEDGGNIRSIPSGFTYIGSVVADTYWYDGLPVLVEGANLTPVSEIIGPLLNRVPIGQGMLGGRLVG